jgi:hypothetical protein
MFNSAESTGTAEYLTLYTRCRINQCRYKRVRLYLPQNNCKVTNARNGGAGGGGGCIPLILVPSGGAICVRSIAVKKVKPRGLFHPTKRETEKSDITPTPNPTAPHSNSPPFQRIHSHTVAMEWHLLSPPPQTIIAMCCAVHKC